MPARPQRSRTLQGAGDVVVVVVAHVTSSGFAHQSAGFARRARSGGGAQTLIGPDHAPLQTLEQRMDRPSSSSSSTSTSTSSSTTSSSRGGRRRSRGWRAASGGGGGALIAPNHAPASADRQHAPGVHRRRGRDRSGWTAGDGGTLFRPEHAPLRASAHIGHAALGRLFLDALFSWLRFRLGGAAGTLGALFGLRTLRTRDTLRAGGAHRTLARRRAGAAFGTLTRLPRSSSSRSDRLGATGAERATSHHHLAAGRRRIETLSVLVVPAVEEGEKCGRSRQIGPVEPK